MSGFRVRVPGLPQRMSRGVIGNTSDFDSEILSSSLDGTTKNELVERQGLVVSVVLVVGIHLQLTVKA